MDCMYNVITPLTKREINEFEDVISNSKSKELFTNKKINVYGFPDLNLNIIYTYDKDLTLSLFSGVEFLKETRFYKVNSMEELLSIFRIDFEYEGRRIFFNFKLELGEFGSDKELISNNIKELELLRDKAKRNETLDITYYIDFVNLNSILNILYCSYLVIAHYLLTKDISKNIFVRERLVQKLKTVGISRENKAEDDKHVIKNLNFMIDFASVNHNNIAATSTLINLITCKTQADFINIVDEVIEKDSILFEIIEGLIKKNAYIHLL